MKDKDIINDALELGASFDWITPFWELFKLSPVISLVVTVAVVITLAIAGETIAGWLIGW